MRAVEQPDGDYFRRGTLCLRVSLAEALAPRLFDIMRHKWAEIIRNRAVL